MSTALGLAATSATLQQILTNGFVALKLDDVLGTTPAVTCLASERANVASETPTLNIALYNQTRNTGWSNLDLPARDVRGERTANPALALDLHYLLVAYGVSDFQAEILLGAAMQILHDTPAFGREAIRAALTPAAGKPNLPKQLILAGLADQLEQLRVTPVNLNADEVSRIWAAIQLPVRPAAAYMLSVLLMQTQRSTRAPLPATERNVYVIGLRAPRVDRIESTDGAHVPIFPTSTVKVIGADLKARSMTLLIDGIDQSTGLGDLSNDELRFTFTDVSDLRAGLCTLQILHPQMMGTPPAPHVGGESNPGVFVLNPQATFKVDPGAIDETIDGVTYRNGSITATVTPPVGRQQRVRLLLNEKNPPTVRQARAYSFDAPEGHGIAAPAQSASSVSFAFRRVLPGAYLARLKVDAGMSPLIVAPDGRFDGPEVSP
ncbi:DUF4255 domain-containing protein [Paraburkholderia dipogonis]|uniref:DUF4255 domain-containing protein n=1 Tax=Paraburkholderia dipogonis TaxID=1211383 RepID=UPI0038BCB872